MTKPPDSGLPQSALTQQNLKFNHSKKPKFSFKSLRYSTKLLAGTSIEGETDEKSSSVVSDGLLVGEDCAVFDLGEQKITSWIYFTGILGVFLFVLDVAWIDNSMGFGKALIDAVSSISESHEVVLLILILLFATVHSALASLRDTDMTGCSYGSSRAFLGSTSWCGSLLSSPSSSSTPQPLIY